MAAPVPGRLATARFVATQVISVTVLDDMRLFVEPVEIARDAEHNSATFRIVKQPDALAGYVCRAEVQTIQGTTYRLVDENGEFSLTSDIAVQGINALQLVYSDGGDIIRKTYKALFHVSASLNALDESDPEFSNGLAQLQIAAFAAVQGSDTAATFYNISGQPVAALIYPPGQGGGIDEATADTLYLRLNGANPMVGNLTLGATSTGILFQPTNVGAIIYGDTGLRFRRGLGSGEITIEDNSGATATRSPIVTQVIGDARYLTPDQGNAAYARRDGAQMLGPFISQLGSSNTNLGLSVGDNASGFWKSSLFLIAVSGAQTVWQASTTEIIFGVRINAATQQITNLGDPTAAQDAVNRRTMDAAIAAIPRPTVPAARVFIPTEVTIGNTAQVFFDQPFFTADNAPRTILVTVQPSFASGTPSQFYDLAYTSSLGVGLEDRMTVYPTASAYMHGSICFAATLTPVSNQIQVQLSVRALSSNPTAIVQVGSRTEARSYVIIQEMSQ